MLPKFCILTEGVSNPGTCSWWHACAGCSDGRRDVSILHVYMYVCMYVFGLGAEVLVSSAVMAGGISVFCMYVCMYVHEFIWGGRG
jgi:hypothetical protein